MVDRLRIGLVNNVKNKTFQCNFIFSSGYRSSVRPCGCG